MTANLTRSAYRKILANRPPDWMERAACTQRNGGPELAQLREDDVFFPDIALQNVVDPASDKRVRRAKMICRDCPVQLDCLRYAIRNDIWKGIWGGLVPRERYRLRTELQRRRKLAS